MEIVHTKQAETVVHYKVEQKQEVIQFAIRRIKGLKLFSLNPYTLEMKEVELEKKVMIGIDNKAVEKNKTFYDPKLIYIQALNRKSAANKFAKIIDDAHYKSSGTN